MFNFFKRPTELHAGEKFRLDMHAHWLPGIDDGAKTVEDSLAIVEGLYAMGYRRLIATPHMYPEMYPNTPDTVRKAFESVAPAIRKRWPDLQIGYAGEYFVDTRFPKLVEEGELLTFDGNRVLVEFPFFAEPSEGEEAFFKLRLKGYKPVFAHVERYGYYVPQRSRLQRFRDMGVEFQCNLLSLTGHYGPEIRKQAETLLDLGWYEWMGTDAHNTGHTEAIGQIKVSRDILSLIEDAELNQL